MLLFCLETPRNGQQDVEKVRQRRSRFTQRFNVPKRTATPLRLLRPCPRNGASWRAGVGRVRNLAFLIILRGCSSLASDARPKVLLF